MDFVPVALFWLITAKYLFGKQHALIYLFFACIPFGTFAVIPPTATGGLTFTPAPMIALMLIIKALASADGRRYFARLGFSATHLGFLLLYWLSAAVTTIFMPRLFEGKVTVVPLKVVAFITTESLRPTTQNISQLAYVTISVLSVFAFCFFLRSASSKQHAMRAMCLGAVLTIFTGMLDFAGQYLPLAPVLEPFRTASYSLLTDTEILGAKRVVGLMPEASSYGSICIAFLSMLYFFRRAMVRSFLSRTIVPVLMGLLLIFTALSTSSAAYLGLVVFGMAATIEWCNRAFFVPKSSILRRGLNAELLIFTSAFVIAFVIVVVTPSLLKPLTDMVNNVVFQKSTTSSFEERNMWTSVSWEAFLATSGLGVGLGGTRASNSAVALISNVGAVGVTFYVIFLIQMMFRRVSPADQIGTAAMNGIRWAFLPGFVVSLLIGTTADFGVRNAFLFGLSMAVWATQKRDIRRSDSVTFHKEHAIRPIRTGNGNSSIYGNAGS